ncbi:hypothetical protein SDRG_01451 [Saprolegnia diclina VS20]|uniref:Uncharacterized protein n=1 Tax=Saprolegnia diclina (strain VS20) TaxID=1156394 RepID=T0QTK8_SAPDV|nr:hypothetical protein SDRG_01451 [Saprolegnia diclina VS20]EQC41484.1 hypothetical protein SDRG_01451 [Saprolegnia diclina VS20]|eukprot:XP_008605198.1 hypothetical protein SDRG_01451 [Saprolegnia diclina VS20]
MADAPLRDLLTVVFTTSAIPSNPATIVLEEVLDSFAYVPGLATCNVVLTFDGYVAKDGDDVKTKFKSTRISADEIEKYVEYQHNARAVFRRHLQLTDAAVVESYDEEFPIKRRTTARATIHRETDPVAGTSLTSIIMSKRMGFALAVREALKHVTTPFVLIHQHDWTFLHALDLQPVCTAMASLPETLKYVGFHSRKTLKKKSRPGLPPPTAVNLGGICVAPLYFWYDKPHVASTEHYRSFVFGHGRFQPGDFIEDTLGHAMLDDLKARGVDAHSEYGTWSYVLDDQDDETATLRHASGRHFREVVHMRSRRVKKGASENGPTLSA